MKHDRFCHLATVSFVDNDAEERRGPWTFLVADRHRFSRRIQQIESMLAPVLTEEHKTLYSLEKHASALYFGLIM